MYTTIKKDILYPELSFEINKVLFKVFNDLGPGHHEKYYQIGIEKGLRFNKIKYQREVPTRLETYDEVVGTLFLDF